MTMRLSSGARNGSVNGIVDLIDAGAGTAVLELWTGSRPTNVGDAPAGTKLASFNLPDPCFGSGSTGVATANSISDTTGLADGTVGFAQVKDKDGNVIWDNNDVNTSGSQIILNTLTITTGGTVSVTSWTVTTPAS